jgi:hypothetical protein
VRLMRVSISLSNAEIRGCLDPTCHTRQRDDAGARISDPRNQAVLQLTLKSKHLVIAAWAEAYLFSTFENG